MLARYKHKNVTWVDLESPTSEEVREIMEEYDLHPIIAEELLLPSLKPKVEFYDNNCIYLILHFPAFKHTHSENRNQEVDFVIGRNFIITTRYDTIDPLHKFSKVFEVDSILDRSGIGNHAGYVFYFMIKKLYRALGHELEYINDALRTIEENIFDGREKDMVVELSQVSRELLNLKQTISLHKEVLESLEPAGRQFFGMDFSFYLRNIIGEYYRVQTAVQSNLDSLHELRETNNSLVSTKQNEVMKVLTIMAFVTFPLSLLASIFGMNTSFLPLVGHPYDFWIIMGIMVAATGVFFAFFHYRNWL
jgi:magnesium transporter